MPKFEIQLDRLFASEQETGAGFIRKFGFLPEFEALRLPVKFGTDEEIYVKRVLGVEVNAVAVLAMILYSGAGAAPEIAIGGVKVLARAGAERDVIAHHACLRVLRGKNMIVEAALVVISILRLRLPAEQM